MADIRRITEATRDGLTFDVADGGPLDGETVLLLHGFPADSTTWDGVAPLLQDAGLRTLAPDQRGYSPRARPEGRRAYVLHELVADALAIADAAGAARVHVVGHDWGAGLAWSLASAPQVASVTALSTPHPGALKAAALQGQMVHSWYIPAMRLPVVPERVVHGMLRRGIAGLPEESRARYAARFPAPSDLTGPIDWYRAVPLPGGTVHRARIPATLVWGSRDPYLGRAAAEATARMCTGDYRFVELDEGHWLPERVPETCAAHIVERVRSA